ncbi:MAG: T9SS type A sorting domain-containing protein, partial [Bacteroidota bacterium]|nr:T9SS type A sorting domain-containing protein [Bacteroidota bacterium]MDX5429857.1 T9SS type A sorting domain-containing protein [Bacteroidota bacterium]MDX5468636.1 T9SS type A sorting domain-containing protein [Bacteroidota bacterium]
IIIEHHLSFDQDLSVAGNAYLNIKVCASLCGNFKLTVAQNAMIYNQGELFCGDLSVQAYLLNQGNIDCTGLAIVAGLFQNGELGYLIGRKTVHACGQKFLPQSFYRIRNLVNNGVVIYLKCPSVIDFGDGSGNVTATDSIQYWYSSYDSFQVNIEVFCDCDTVSFQEKLLIEPKVPDTDSSCFEFNIFPNPNDGNFQVRFLQCRVQTELLKVPLYNSAGQLIRYIDLNQNGETQVYSVPDVAPGVYYLAMPPSSGAQAQKLLIFK